LEVQLFAHYLWNSAILLADMISSGLAPVYGETVLELGAGAGLPGILAALEGAELVVLSDYDSPPLLSNLSHNVEQNVPEVLKPTVKVQSYIRGHDCSAITRYLQGNPLG
jgi:nicotinamide N-methyltransferase